MSDPQMEARNRPGDRLLYRSSPYDVADTVRRLIEAARAKGITVFAVIDHAQGARDAGLDMPETQVVVLGNPTVGTPAMLTAPDIALSLPTRVLVRAAGLGTEVVCNDPDTVAGRHGLSPDQAKGLAGITRLVDVVLG